MNLPALVVLYISVSLMNRLIPVICLQVRLHWCCMILLFISQTKTQLCYLHSSKDASSWRKASFLCPSWVVSFGARGESGQCSTLATCQTLSRFKYSAAATLQASSESSSVCDDDGQRAIRSSMK